MKPRHEDRASRVQREINELEEKQAEYERAVERAKARLDEFPPRLRDRNRFFNVLLHGEREKLERTALPWRDFKRSDRECRQIKKQLSAKERKIDKIIRKGVLADSGWQTKLAREKAARQSCEKLLKLINQARRRINRPIKGRPQTEEACSKVDQEVTEVSAALKAVRGRIGDVDQKTFPHRSFAGYDTTRLEIDIPGSGGDHGARAKKYREVKDVLDATETRAKSILGDVERREKDLQAQLRQEIVNERARFNETPPPPP